MTFSAATRRAATAAFLLLTVSFAILVAGCAVDRTATPDAEISAGVRTRDEAKAIQAESKTRADDANAVLGDK